jgi:5-(carboxyamino)imidazole ribonucleotide synthase
MKIGIIGDGQLGRMLALAGYELGFKFGFLGQKNSPSGSLGTVFDDIQALDNFADVITYESENTSLNLIQYLNTPIYPPIEALKIAQNRKLEKQLFNDLNIPCANFAIATTLAELTDAVDNIGLPAVIKTTTEGYDGKGQFVLKTKQDIDKVWRQLNGLELIVEGFVDFDYEVSIIASFSQNEVEYYPLTKNTHQDGILKTAEVIDNQKLFDLAQKHINKIATKFNYIGTLTIEFFVKANELIANEMAPRVHNSGHWSIDGAKTSQFANHIRAITHLPLGDSVPIYQHIKMQNIIGKLSKANEVLADKNSILHLYDKEPRVGRKLGHINICHNE